MVEYLDTVVAHTAVATPRRTIELTGNTPFHPNLKRTKLFFQHQHFNKKIMQQSHRYSVNLHISVERSTEVIISVLVRTGAGDDAGVHEGGHGEVDEDEECDDPLEYRDRVPLLHQNVPLDAAEKKRVNLC